MSARPLVLLLPAIGCSSISAAGGWTHHDQIASSRFSHGATGSALAVEAGGTRAVSRGEIGAFATIDYLDQADARAMWFGASARYRRSLLGSGRATAYAALGGGAGASSMGGRIAAHAELGARFGLGATTALALSVRERPSVQMTERDASGFNLMNTFEVAAGFELRSDASSQAPPDPRQLLPVRCTPRWGWFLEATAWAGLGLGEDTEGLLRNGGGAIYRSCDDLQVRAGLVLSLWATGEDRDQQHGVFGLYRIGPELELDFLRAGDARLGVAAGVDVAFGRAHEGGADLAVHGGVRFRYQGLVLGADVAHGLDPPGPPLDVTYKRATTVVLGIGQSGHAPYLGFLLELVAYTIAVNQIHRN